MSTLKLSAESGGGSISLKGPSSAGSDTDFLDTSGNLNVTGKVGIGETSPDSSLHIKGTAGSYATGVKIENTANANTGLIFDAARTSASVGLGAIEARWSGNSVARIRLDAGTDTTNKDDGALSLQTCASGSSPTNRLQITNSGVWYTSLYSTNTNAGLSANVFVFSDGSMGRASSSGKWKKNIETIQDSYADKILTMRPAWYQQDDTKVNIPQDQNKDWGYWGFIAEEVAAIDPRLVTWKVAEYTTEDTTTTRTPLSEPEPDNVAYERFVPHLVNLIKRQDDRIKTLETKVAALEAG